MSDNVERRAQCEVRSKEGRRCSLRAGHPTGPMYSFFTDFEGHIWEERKVDDEDKW